MDSRVEYNVYVKVWDGRRLKNCKDTFVSIVAGGEEKERTPTQWQSNEPPYNHECNITLESALPELSFTLYDLRKKGNFTVGEVAMPLSWGEAATAQRKAVKKQGGALSEAYAAQTKAANTQVSTPGVSDWWDLKAKTTLDVMSKLEICLENLGGGFVNVSIVKASGIGTSKDEKWVVGYNRTKVKGKMEFTPAFKTDFAKDAAWKAVPWKFEIKDEIRFELFENHDGQNDVLGMVTFPPNCWNDVWNGAKERFAWPLQPVEPGSLRLEYWPSKLYILAETKYDELFKLLLEDDFKLVKLLWKVVDPKAVTSLAMALMRACEKKRAAVGLLKALLQEETNHIKTFDTSFRGNTLATKTFEYYMKLTCLTHLHQVLKPTMAKLLEGKKSCELDPVRIEVKGKAADAKTQSSTIKKNTENLIKYCQTLLDSVLNLVEILPMSMRVILTELKKWFLEKFDNNMNAVYAGLTAFVFLRLIAPAISQPTVFGLTTSHPSKDAARTLMLCAITLQKLSNLKEFGDGKEPHMMVMNEWIKKSIPKMKTFLETLSSMPTKPIDAIPVDHVLIDYGREMAVVADFVKASIDALKGAYPDEPCIGNLLIIQEDLNIAHAALQSAGK